MRVLRWTMLAAIFAISFWTAAAQTTQFTYQGSLSNGGSPANGNFDFEFRLFDAVSGGSQHGSTIERTNVIVTNGIFAVSLDFGAGALPGTDRYIDISVRQSGGGAFTPLAPRRQLTSTPYAIRSLHAASADTVAVGGVPPGSGSYIQNQNAGAQASSNFNISGNGTAAGSLSAGTINAVTQYNIGGTRVLSNAGEGNLFAGANAGTGGSLNSFFGSSAGTMTTTGTGNSFFGSSAGRANSTGHSNAMFGGDAGFENTASFNAFFGTNAGRFNTTGDTNSFLGTQAGQSNTTGRLNTFVGSLAGGSHSTGTGNTALGSSTSVANVNNATAIGYRAVASQDHTLVLGGILGVNGCTAGNNCNSVNVGIGTTQPTERLHVAGNSLITGDLTVNGTLNATLPQGSGNYVQNQLTGPQANTNFFISGRGIANSFTAFSRYDIGAHHALSASGTDNLFGGRNSGEALTNGQGNAFFGARSGQINTSGNFNSIFGAGSGSANTTGGGNSFFGNNSGSSNETGSNNTLIGAEADVAAGNLTNATAIGYQARVSQSNSLVLGSINGVGGATANTSVGIGTTAPERKLHIRGAGAQEIMIESSDAGGIKWTVQSSGSAGNGRFEIIDRTANLSRLTILESGFLGIGTTSPDQRLSVNGNASKASGGTTWAVFSDARLKNIHGKFTPGLNALMKLQPIRFRYRDDNPLGLPNGETAVGFSAQDVAQIIPEAVTRSEDGFLQLHSDPILWTMLNAIKEQQAQIEAQRAENEKLTTKLDSQQREIDALKAVICERLETAVCRRP